MPHRLRRPTCFLPYLLTPLALACAALPAFALPGIHAGFNEKPRFLGSIVSLSTDGVSDDLLTAGLGGSGLQGAAPPVSAVPTAAELRRLAIYNNYRALVDVTEAGGFGDFFGPTLSVSASGQVSDSGDGRIAGTEYLAYASRRDGGKVTLMVQVPAHFDPRKPCIVTGTSSGSRGIYGAIGTSGEWGLQKGCAVAYTDKGTGNGMHDLASDTVGLIDGTRTDAAAAGGASHFTADLSASERADFLAAWPHRVAVKHAHSQTNPEADWGRDTLDAVRFAFYVLNEKYGIRTPKGVVRTIIEPNTVVIAASVSNGGGAALAAAEQDEGNLIDGVAVGEPQIQLRENPRVAVRRGNQPARHGSGRPLYDYTTYATLLQPCATLSPRAAGSPGAAFVPAALAANRCEALAAHGLISGGTPEARGDDALDKLLDYGWEPESTPLAASHYAFAVPAIALTYANSYGRFGVEDRICNYSFAAVAANAPAPWSASAAAMSFGTGNGIPPASGLQIINDAAVGGPRSDAASVSASTGKADFNVDGALCLRALWTDNSVEARRVHRSVDALRVKGDLNGKPAIIVHGRADALVPVGFTSRPYLGANQLEERGRSRLRYIEVTNAQHFDAFIGNAALPGYDTRFVPLHVYYRQALDLMYEHLTARRPLPPSQVVRTEPRKGTPGAAVKLTEANVPPISANPLPGNRITVRGGEVYVPE